MEPLYAHTEGGTWARVFLYSLGYAVVEMIPYRCSLTYSKALETMKGIKEGVYTNNARISVELT